MKPTRRPIREHHLEPSELLLVQRLVREVDELGSRRVLEVGLPDSVLKRAVANRWLKTFDTADGSLLALGHQGFTLLGKTAWYPRGSRRHMRHQAAMHCAVLALGSPEVHFRHSRSCFVKLEAQWVPLRAFSEPLLPEVFPPRYGLTAIVTMEQASFRVRWIARGVASPEIDPAHASGQRHGA